MCKTCSGRSKILLNNCLPPLPDVEQNGKVIFFHYIRMTRGSSWLMVSVKICI